MNGPESWTLVRRSSWPGPGGQGHKLPSVPPLPLTVTARQLESSDLPAVLALHAAAHRAMPSPGLLAREAPEFLAAHLGGTDAGRTLGVEDQGRLVSYAVLSFPMANDPYHFGHLLAWPPERLARTSLCDGAIVAEGYRGLGLHDAMIAARLRWSVALGREESLATAAPGNPWSWRNLLRRRFVARAWFARFGGQRYLLHYAPGGRLQVDWATTLLPPVEEHIQRQLFAEGWVGVSPEHGPGSGSDTKAPENKACCSSLHSTQMCFVREL